jgi:NADH:ubiquinone oxidoreductase subunit 4 (subunit M)
LGYNGIKTTGGYIMETKTYKLIKIIAYAILAVGAIFIVAGLAAHTDKGILGAIIAIIASAVCSSLFLFFAKIIEQNEERNKQNEQLNKLLTEQLNRIHMTLKNIDRSMDA